MPKAPVTVAVVGVGKIGLPLAVQFAQHGYSVIGCDVNAQVVEMINAGHSHVVEEPELRTEVPRLVHAGLLRATQDTTAAVRLAQIVVVIVPVVVDADHHIDFALLDAATQAIGEGLEAGTLVIYETTLPVGTTAHRLAGILEHAAQLKAGEDFWLAYSPERVSSGSIFRDLRLYPKIVGGIDPSSTKAAETFYHSVLDAPIITMSSTDDAEFVKLIETTYRDVNIGLANEYACYADVHGLDVMAAIEAANTQPYSHIHSPGVGVGGHCIPVYPYFLFANPLDSLADEQIQEVSLQLPRLSRAINDRMALYCVKRLEKVLGPLHGQTILILGVAYRGNVRETAFTSAKLLQTAFLEHGARVYVHDPLFGDDELRAEGYTPVPPGGEDEPIALILQSDHGNYHPLDITRFSGCQVFFDGRYAFYKERESIEAAGVQYMTIGDGEFLRKTNKVSREALSISAWEQAG